MKMFGKMPHKAGRWKKEWMVEHIFSSVLEPN